MKAATSLARVFGVLVSALAWVGPGDATAAVDQGARAETLVNLANERKAQELQKQILSGRWRPDRTAEGSKATPLTPMMLDTMTSTCYQKIDSCQTDHEVLVQVLDDLVSQRKVSKKELRKIARRFFSSFTVDAGKNLGLGDGEDSRRALFDQLLFAVTFQERSTYVREHLDGALQNLVDRSDLDRRTRNLLLSYQDQLGPRWSRIMKRVTSLNEELETSESLEFATTDIGPRNVTQMAYDLAYGQTRVSQYMEGRYANLPVLLMYCRSDRNFPCLMLIRNRQGQLHRRSSGALWTQPSLGLSRHGKQFHQTNGNTPSGVWRIDGVMPEADDRLIFGKFRRLILNFVGRTSGEANLRLLLPDSSHAGTWWREGVVARDNGRGLFRIHGTGWFSTSSKPYFPLVPTSGCVAKRENRHNGVEYRDQRLLLDEMMRVQGLTVNFANEARIRGLLYVINIDNQRRAVTLADLRQIGIQ
jgi:hypothetical protein